MHEDGASCPGVQAAVTRSCRERADVEGGVAMGRGGREEELARERDEKGMRRTEQM